ncbi:MAG: alpha/beta hydrolase [Candidatus Tectomicrobia bacterium]|nr:alpha/beta hydrolase [Candidatus Tectomicrobia bacterium]
MGSCYVYIDGQAINILFEGETALSPKFGNYMPTFQRGQTVLFVHGAGGNANPWTPQMRALAKDHTPVAIDLPGHGNSGGIDGLTSIRAYSEFIKKFADTVGLPPFVLVGSSMGGAIALDFGINYPDRAKGLVLVATGAKIPIAAENLKALKDAKDGKARVNPDRAAYSPKTSDEIVRRGWAEMAKTDVKIRYFDMVACNEYDVSGSLKNIKARTLIICGKDDVITPPSYSETLKASIPSAQLELIDDAGHVVNAEKPDPFNAAVTKFLGTL